MLYPTSHSESSRRKGGGFEPGLGEGGGLNSVRTQKSFSKK